ncbi:hypothetical protein BJ508DRAFT_333394 [Ascobolus immersus RN42]|uniref:Uncharacterized protein n=1 Tax=Ascobolus immersus RN42 TaxID=1160509 RepID=A0A3N4HJT6_ASCIM|nr:hypothetical protein BJ508DRAFT_333394 [Ascobolus immersus RN42]
MESTEACPGNVESTEACPENFVEANLQDRSEPFQTYRKKLDKNIDEERDELLYEAKQIVGQVHQAKIDEHVKSLHSTLSDYAFLHKLDVNAVLFCAGWYQWTFPYAGRLMSGSRELFGKTGKRNSWNQYCSENKRDVTVLDIDKDYKDGDEESEKKQMQRWKNNALSRQFTVLGDKERETLDARTLEWNTNNARILDFAGNDIAASNHVGFSIKKERETVRRIGNMFQENMIDWSDTLERFNFHMVCMLVHPKVSGQDNVFGTSSGHIFHDQVLDLSDIGSSGYRTFVAFGKLERDRMIYLLAKRHGILDSDLIRLINEKQSLLSITHPSVKEPGFVRKKKKGSGGRTVTRLVASTQDTSTATTSDTVDLSIGRLATRLQESAADVYPSNEIPLVDERDPLAPRFPSVSQDTTGGEESTLDPRLSNSSSRPLKRKRVETEAAVEAQANMDRVRSFLYQQHIIHFPGRFDDPDGNIALPRKPIAKRVFEEHRKRWVLPDGLTVDDIYPLNRKKAAIESFRRAIREREIYIEDVMDIQ